jgi:hypothetical protein
MSTELEALSAAFYRYIWKASRPRALARHRLAVHRLGGAMERAWGRWKAEMVRQLGSVRTLADLDRVAWATIEERGQELFSGPQERAFIEGGRHLALHKGRTDLIGRSAKHYVASTGAKRIVDVTSGTKTAVRSIITRGINWGWSPADVGRRLRPLIGLTDRQTAAASNLYSRLLEQGISDSSAWSKTQRYASTLQRARTETIARTETNNALRQGIIDASGQRGVELLDRIGDPQCCELCAQLNAAGPYTPEEASDEDIANPHPNCECTFVIAVQSPQGDKEFDLAEVIGGAVELGAMAPELWDEVASSIKRVIESGGRKLDYLGTGGPKFDALKYSRSWKENMPPPDRYIAYGGQIGDDQTAVLLSPDVFKSAERMNASFTRAREAGWLMAPTLDGMMAHEYAHGIDILNGLSSQTSYRAMIGRLINREGTDWMSGYIQDIYESGMTSLSAYEDFFKESFAELYSAYETGKTLPDEVMAYFKSVKAHLKEYYGGK